MFSGFRHKVVETFALLCYYDPSSGNFFQKFRDQLVVPKRPKLQLLAGNNSEDRRFQHPNIFCLTSVFSNLQLQPNISKL